ncbi:unnamed protein product [Gordionus sp. m RMFG-2023]
MNLWIAILTLVICFPYTLTESAFQIIWNSPTQVCKFRYNNDLHLESFNILTNINQTLRGQLVSLLYDTQSGAWPNLVQNTTTNTTVEVNGGIPQKGNLANHLAALESSLNTLIPDTQFQGLSVIDFEKYLPWWSQTNYGVYQKYQDASIDYFKSRNPSVTDTAQINAGAGVEFENAVKLFMQNTIIRASDLRPNAKWGYFMYPECARY